MVDKGLKPPGTAPHTSGMYCSVCGGKPTRAPTCRRLHLCLLLAMARHCQTTPADVLSWCCAAWLLRTD